MSPVTRRDFLVGGGMAGIGLALGLWLPRFAGPGSFGGLGRGGEMAESFSPNAWLTIDRAGDVKIIVALTEMGQGIRTALPMLIAEELEADWDKVHVEGAMADRTLYGGQGTGGSSSVRDSWETLRKAGAAAREMLVAAAAARWQVVPSKCRAEKGTVVHPDGKQRLSYGDLVDAAARLPVPSDQQLKNPKDFKLIGTRVKRVDAPSKVNGTAVFGIDVKETESLPGMVYAALVRPPVFGGKLTGFEIGEAKSLPGVHDAVKAGDAVAVIAGNTWAALEGRRRLKVNWDRGENAGLSSETIRALFAEKAGQAGKTWRLAGDPDQHLAAGKVVEATYELPFQAHATLEPGNCTAWVHDGLCDMWAPTQVPQRVQAAVGKALDIPSDAVRLHITLLGGGFGRRLESDYAVEAALVSKAVGKPVKVVWSREDDLRHDFYRPASWHVLRGAVDAEGWPVAFSHKIVAPSITARRRPEILETGREPVVEIQSTFLYDIPNLRLEYVMANTPVPIGPWRSVYASQIAFPSECFFDELCAAGGKDPVEARLRLLQDDHNQRELVIEEDHWKPARLRGVVALAAEKAGWGQPLPPGRFRGIACYPEFGTYVAQVAEVSVDAAGVHVHRVVCAVDCGIVVNPDILEQQIEGSILFGLSAALKNEITFAEGGVQQTNFGDYDVLRLREAPQVEVHTVPSTEPPMGIGEPAVPVIAPAVANAVFAATGKRVRRLPVRGLTA
jgi:isoquinoline 1-oxidoreductase beta subunit